MRGLNHILVFIFIPKKMLEFAEINNFIPKNFLCKTIILKIYCSLLVSRRKYMNYQMLSDPLPPTACITRTSHLINVHYLTWLVVVSLHHSLHHPQMHGWCWLGHSSLTLGRVAFGPVRADTHLLHAGELRWAAGDVHGVWKACG